MTTTHLILDNFVSTDICRLLQLAGLQQDTAFTYRLYQDGTCNITSKYFDYLNLYQEIEVKGVHMGYTTMAAYTLADMMALMPPTGYIVQYQNNKATVCIDAIYNEIKPVTENTLANALGLMVYNMIKSRFFNNLNQLLKS